MTITFGPVPSRRLGRSLGINNIPPKFCSYSCLYCQVGATDNQLIKPREFYRPQKIYQEVTTQVVKATAAGESIDYLTFVPDGEPTLDTNLGRAIELLRPLNIPIAVISNASLLWREDVRAAISKADWVSIKVDSVIEDVWRQINRPHNTLQLKIIMDGIRQFAKQFQGKLVAETMLIKNINDTQNSVSDVADFLHEIDVSISYLSIPTRPTAESGTTAPGEVTLSNAYHIMANRMPNVEYLIGYEGDAFAFTGNVEQDLLSITAVHPMRESAVKDLLIRASADWSLIEKMIEQGKLKKIDYLGRHFIVRSLNAKNKE